MKKSLSIFLCALMIALTFCSCKFVKTKDPKETGADTTASTATTAGKKEDETSESEKKGEDKSASGEAITVFVTDKNGEVVTNKDGTAKTEALDLESLGKQLEEKAKEEASKTTKKTTAKNSSGKTEAANDVIPEIQSSEEDLMPEGTKAKDTTLMKTVVEPVLKAGTYTIKGNVKIEGFPVSVQMAFRNGKDYAVEMSLMGLAIRMFTKDGKSYMAMPTLGVYSPTEDDEMGDFSEISEALTDSKEAKYAGTTTVKYNGQKYTCEEYKTSTGSTKYYFNSKNEWKRMEIIEGDMVVVWEITSFTKNVNKAMFEIGKLWKKYDSVDSMLSSYGK